MPSISPSSSSKSIPIQSTSVVRSSFRPAEIDSPFGRTILRAREAGTGSGEDRRDHWVELEARRRTILSAIEEQGKLTPELRRTIEACRKKQELEDLYLPYKTKRRTRAMIARERGLEPLTARILAQPSA